MKYQSVSLAALLLMAGTSLAAAQSADRPQRGGEAGAGQAERAAQPSAGERAGAGERGGASRGAGSESRGDSAAQGRAEGEASGGERRQRAQDRAQGTDAERGSSERREAREEQRNDRKEAREGQQENRNEAREEQRNERRQAQGEQRNERQDAREEQRENRQDARQDQREDRREAREEQREERNDQRQARDGNQNDNATRGAATGDAAGSDRQNRREGRRERVEWNDDQRRRVREGFRKERDGVRHHTNVNFEVTIGRRLPRDWDYRPVPSFVIDLAPRYRGYRYAYVEDRYVIISPDTYEVVAYIDEDSGRVYASSGGSADCTDVSFSTDERRRILREIEYRNQRDFAGISIGFNIPGGVELLTFPETLGYDELDGCRYVALGNDRIAVIAPSSRRVVAILD